MPSDVRVQGGATLEYLPSSYPADSLISVYETCGTAIECSCIIRIRDGVSVSNTVYYELFVTIFLSLGTVDKSLRPT